MCPGDFEAMVAKPIRVVQMLPELHAGGVERGTLEIAAYLSALGHQSTVISGGGRMVPELCANGSRHITWPVGRKSPLVFRYFFPLRRFLVQEAIDVLHVRSRVPAWIAFWVLKSLSPSDRPVFITTFHGFYSINRYSAIMTKGERIIAISEAIASHIKNRYPAAKDRIVLINRGFDSQVFDPSKVTTIRLQTIRRRWQLSAISEPIIMLPGRITRLKGQDVFIKSLGMIKSLSWHVIIVGDRSENESYSSYLDDLIHQEGLANRVRFVGHCEDMPAALMLADVVVSVASTHPEGFGRIAVEAQAMGKPVIASAHGGSLETVLAGETGWLVTPRDAVSLSKALKEAVRNKDMRLRYGRRGREWVGANFTIDVMCERTLELYQQTLTRTSRN